MNSRFALLMAFLALALVRTSAGEPGAAPASGDSGENVFVGHYGEIVRVPYLWSVDASMQGPIEVVNLHLTNEDPLKVVSPLFKPRASDYVPENFHRLRLMQMRVVPKDTPGGARSLEALRGAKKNELDLAGVPYTLMQLGDYSWPPDSFWVSISTPYSLFQLYTQSDKDFFIMTSGTSPYVERSHDPLFVNSTADLANGMSTYLDDSRLKIIAEKGFLKDLRIVVIPWAVVCVFAALLSVLPKGWNWLSRLRLIGRATVAFTSASQLLAGPILFASWRMGLDRTLNEGSILFYAALIMPWICRTVSARRGGQRLRRVFIWSALVNVLPIWAGYLILRDFTTGSTVITGSQNFLRMSHSLSILAVLNGVIVGLAHQEGGVMNSPDDAS